MEACTGENIHISTQYIPNQLKNLSPTQGGARPVARGRNPYHEVIIFLLQPFRRKLRHAFSALQMAFSLEQSLFKFLL